MRRSSTRLVLASFVASAVAACSSFSSSEPAPAAPVEGGADLDGGAAAEGGEPLDAGSSEGSVGEPDAEAGAPLLKAFVTTVGYADITTAASADAKCTAEAAGRVPGKFVAWFSYAGVPAPARLVDHAGDAVDGPWYRLDGSRIVANRAALSKTSKIPLEHPIDVNAVGTKVSISVWTGTKADGSQGAVCPAPAPVAGAAGQTGIAWTEQSFFMPTCGSSLGVYCFQVE